MGWVITRKGSQPDFRSHQMVMMGVHMGSQRNIGPRKKGKKVLMGKLPKKKFWFRKKTEAPAEQKKLLCRQKK